MVVDPATSIVTAYGRWFGTPTDVLRVPHEPAPNAHVDVVIYLPDDAEQRDPDGNVSLLGTAGLSAAPIVQDRQCELGIEVAGRVGADDARTLSRALVDLACTPLETGRPFSQNQILANVSLPIFSRFQFALLLDWDPIDGFRFPSPLESVGLLRILPLFESEVRFVEAHADRSHGYLALFNRGLRMEAPDRAPIV